LGDTAKRGKKYPPRSKKKRVKSYRKKVPFNEEKSTVGQGAMGQTKDCNSSKAGWRRNHGFNRQKEPKDQPITGTKKEKKG